MATVRDRRWADLSLAHTVWLAGEQSNPAHSAGRDFPAARRARKPAILRPAEWRLAKTFERRYAAPTPAAGRL